MNQELDAHIENIKAKFGTFIPPASKVHVTAETVDQHLMNMIPGAFEENPPTDDATESMTMEIEDNNSLMDDQHDETVQSLSDHQENISDPQAIEEDTFDTTPKDKQSTLDFSGINENNEHTERGAADVQPNVVVNDKARSAHNTTGEEISKQFAAVTKAKLICEEELKALKKRKTAIKTKLQEYDEKTWNLKRRLLSIENESMCAKCGTSLQDVRFCSD